MIEEKEKYEGFLHERNEEIKSLKNELSKGPDDLIFTTDIERNLSLARREINKNINSQPMDNNISHQIKLKIKEEFNKIKEEFNKIKVKLT